MEDKNNDMKKLQDEYNEGINKIKNEYKEEIESEKTMKNEFYYNELFEDIKYNILKIIKPINNKKASFIDIVADNKSKKERNE